MNRTFFILITVLFLMMTVLSPAAADDAKAREIMQKVEDRDDGDHMTSNMLMTLIDKNGQQRQKYFQNFTR